jgi:hypothetical protein
VIASSSTVRYTRPVDRERIIKQQSVKKQSASKETSVISALRTVVHKRLAKWNGHGGRLINNFMQSSTMAIPLCQPLCTILSLDAEITLGVQ